MSVKVLLVDDHDIVRKGIKSLLADDPQIKVVGEAESGETAIALARKTEPQVVLMDVKMPGIGGLEATRKLLRINADMKILILTSCDEDPFPSRLLQAGASGYITKGCSVEEMILAIKTVNTGKRYISPAIAQQLALKHLSDNDASPFDILSERELQVMIMITSGLKVQQISEKLCLSPKTVNSYRYRLFEKLNIKSDVELTHLAMRYGMLDSERDS